MDCGCTKEIYQERERGGEESNEGDRDMHSFILSSVYQIFSYLNKKIQRSLK